jgi:REP element-mobilizing transposase RayT
MIESRYYHIFNRGNNRDALFYELENYQYFIDKFRHYLDDFVEVYAYCLMKTHFHFLIKNKNQPPANNTDNAKPPLLTPVEKAFRDFYLKNIIRYIHLNPVVSELCNRPEEYEHSSYNKILTMDASWINVNEIIELLGNLSAFKQFNVFFDLNADFELINEFCA